MDVGVSRFELSGFSCGGCKLVQEIFKMALFGTAVHILLSFINRCPRDCFV